MMNRLIPIAAIAALLMAGCEKSPTENAREVDEARDSAALNVDEARKDAGKTQDKTQAKVAEAQDDYAKTAASANRQLSVVEAEAMRKNAEAALEVATAEAEGRQSIAREKCGVLEGAEKDACLSSADALLASDQASAIAARDAILVEAERHQ